MLLAAISRRVATRCSSASALPSRALSTSVASASTSTSSSVSDSQYFVFPQPRSTGGDLALNWSLVEDGVVAAGAAVRNVSESALQRERQRQRESIPFNGQFVLEESGRQLDHSAFQTLLAEAQQGLASADDLFVEDGVVGAHREARTGVRLISTSAASVSLLRKMMITAPQVDVDPRARFVGWNLDARWNEPRFDWNGKNYERVPDIPLRGQRPIVVYDGLTGNKAAVQFVEVGEKIVGANIVVGSQTPKRAILESVGHAVSVLNNSSGTSLHLPCSTLYNGRNSAYLVNADETTLAKLFEKGLLYCPYYSIHMNSGVTSLWNGLAMNVAENSEFSDNVSVQSVDPDNLVPTPTKLIVFGVEGNADMVIQSLQSTVDGKSLEILQNVVAKSSIHSVKSIEEIIALLK